MRYYVIINGVNSLTIQGLAISKLPSISKPMMRNMREEIDGRDGDITTELGYGAYDKSLEIGLFGNYDINEIIAFFNSKGTIVFSDEPDKYYNFEILEKIDFEKLLKFKTAIVSIHCQPFKYPLTETPQEIEYEYVSASGDNLSINNTAEAQIKSVQLDGQTSQSGTPTPTAPQDVHVVSGDNEINICGRNQLRELIQGNINTTTGEYSPNNQTSYRISPYFMIANGNKMSVKYQTSYNSPQIVLFEYKEDYSYIGFQAYSVKEKTFTLNNETKYVKIRIIGLGTGNTDITGAMVNTGNSIDYEPYIETKYSISLPVDNILNPTTNSITNPSGENTLTTIGDLNLIENTTYYISYNIENDSSTNTRNTPRLLLNGSMVGIEYGSSNYNLTKGRKVWEFNCTASGTYTLQYWCHTPNVAVKVDDFMVSTIGGEKVNNYVPYGTTPIELCKIGNYKDAIYKGKGFNLLDRTACTENVIFAWATGQGSAVNNSLGSNYIKVEIGEKYHQNFASQVMFYNKDKIYLGCMQSGGITIEKSSGDYFKDFTIPSFDGIYYMRLGYRVSYGGNPANMLDKFIMLNKGDALQPFEPYDAKDKWVLNKEIGKVVLIGDDSEGWALATAYANNTRYNSSNVKLGKATPLISNYFLEGTGGTDTTNIDTNGTTGQLMITIPNSIAPTKDDLTSWLSTHNTTIYYVLETSFAIQITDETLINQLDALANGSSYEPQTNILQENNDLPFYLEIDVMKNGTNEAVINNEGNIYSKPTIALVGTGIVNIYLNGVQMFQVDLSETNEITIDTEHMEAYNPNDNTLANRKVIGDYSKFKLDVGNNTIKIDGALTSATITNYKRWL